MRNKTVSIAMAVCNGEKYLPAQIDSILCQLEDNDELIISYDPSNDGTLQVVKEYEKRDKRVHVVINNDHSRGLVSNFDNALRQCSKQIILYSDQDDIWMPDKIDKMVFCFDDPKVSVAIHDAKITDENLNVTIDSTFKLRGGSTSFWKNLIRLSYIGCSMAFRSELLPVVLPLPTRKRSYDWWTGSICSCYGKMAMVNEPLILHRMHQNNATPKKRPPLSYQISVRWIIISNILKRRIFARRER